MNTRDTEQLAANKDSNQRASRLGYNAGLKGEATNPYPPALDGSGMANSCYWEDAYWRGRKARVKAGGKPLGGLVNSKGKAIA